jgi:hypothetical protein
MRLGLVHGGSDVADGAHDRRDIVSRHPFDGL